MGNIKKDLEIIKGANEILNYRKNNKIFTEEKAMAKLLDFLKDKKHKKSRVEILVGASRALNMIERNKNISDREVISKIMQDIPNIKISE